MRKISFGEFRYSIWSRVAALTAVLFFIFLADAILSDWVPNFMQVSLGSPVLMGLIMSFSSVVGFGADIIFPQLFRDTSVKKLMLLATASGMLFALFLLISTARPLIVIFLLAMAVWGLYYEFLHFANQQFVAETAQANQRTQVWAVMGIFKNLAYFLGPILGGVLLVRGDKTVVLVAGLITVGSYVILSFLKHSNKKVEVPMEEINIVKEVSHWWVLLEHVWPVLVISLVLGIVDATFWTTGTVLTEILAKENWWGSLFLPMYTLPSLFVGFLVLKWGVYKGKKKWAEIFMFLGGLFLVFLALSSGIAWQLLMVFLSSAMLSVTYPLTDAVYSDIVSRMGRERKHLIGLSSSMISLAYIVGPVLAGIITSQVGERSTFVTMGVMMSVVSLFLLVVTPKKLKLPQQEIETWE